MTAGEALKLGLTDGIVQDDELINGSLMLLEQAISGRINWQARRQQKKRRYSYPLQNYR